MRNLVRMYNVIGVALSLGLIRMPLERMLVAIDHIFSKKPVVAEMNKQVAKYSHDIAIQFDGFGQKLSGTSKSPDTILVQGHYGTSVSYTHLTLPTICSV